MRWGVRVDTKRDDEEGDVPLQGPAPPATNLTRTPLVGSPHARLSLSAALRAQRRRTPNPRFHHRTPPSAVPREHTPPHLQQQQTMAANSLSIAGSTSGDAAPALVVGSSRFGSGAAMSIKVRRDLRAFAALAPGGCHPKLTQRARNHLKGNRAIRIPDELRHESDRVAQGIRRTGQVSHSNLCNERQRKMLTGPPLPCGTNPGRPDG